MLLTDRTYKIIVGTLCILILTYLIFRAFYTEPLHDEIATYMFYFYYGDYIGENIHWDANNHLLNSFIGHNLYKLVGENLFILRLPNLISFVLYFFGVFQLTKNFNRNSLRILSLISLVSIPFVIEYFANMRGYGLSMGFFVWALVYIQRYASELSAKHLLLSYVFILLAVSANLTFVNSSLLIFIVSVILPFISAKKWGTKKKIKISFVHLFFLLSLMPFVYFGFQLKEKGALYYGSLDGLWSVTGKTLSQYTLFYNGDWLKYIYSLLFVCFIWFAIRLLKKLELNYWGKQAYLLYFFLFFGNICGIVILANFMKVNYPEDRTGMYLIILFLLMIFHILNSFSWGKIAEWLLLFFPVSFLFHLSLHTSVFSPDDRMNADFFQKIKAEIKPEHSIMIYKIMNWNWPFSESHYQKKSSVGLFFNHNTTLTDWVITKTTVFNNSKILELYDTIAYDVPSTYIAYRRKHSLKKTRMNYSDSEKYKGDTEFYNIATFNCEELSKKNIQISTKANLITKEIKNALQLIVSVSKEDGNSSRYLYYDFGTTYQGQLINDDYLHHFLIDSISSDEKEIKVYIWNRKRKYFEISNIRTEIIELNTSENESR